MSRSGYSDDYGDEFNNAGDLWQQAVTRALLGRRGQTFLREMRDVLDALPAKRLIRNDLVYEGEVCALGAVAAARGIDVSCIDPENVGQVAATLGIARAMAAEIEYQNDEAQSYEETPEQRFVRIRAWVDDLLRDV